MIEQQISKQKNNIQCSRRCYKAIEKKEVKKKSNNLVPAEKKVCITPKSLNGNDVSSLVGNIKHFFEIPVISLPLNSVEV